MPSILGSCLRPILVAWLLTTTCSVWAQNAFSPGGTDYAIAGNLAGDQTAPQAAVDANGGLLVWQDNAAGNTGLGIRAIRLNANFTKVGSEFRVNSLTAGEHEKPQVARLPGGKAVIVWQGGTPGFQKIYARYLAPTGTSFSTGDILVNTYTNGYQINPSVTALADGSVVVVWASAGQDGSYQGVFGQRLSSTGAKIGAEFPVNQFTLYNQRTPSVAALADGGFVVTWVSELQRGNASVDVYARRFDATATPSANEFAVNPSTTNICANPSVAASLDGGFAISWSQKDEVVRAVENQSSGFPANPASPNGWDVFAKLYKNNAAPLGSPIRLNTRVHGDQFAPKINAFGKNYLAVWVSLGQDGAREGVFAQFLQADGSLAGVEFQVNTFAPSRQIHPALATDGINRFLVMWTTYVAGSAFDLAARSYDLIRATLVNTAQGMAVTWNSIPGCTYQVQISTSLTSPAWANLGAQRTATGTSDTVPVTSTAGVAYYRVIRVQ